jgi:hypothetical protein
MHCASCGSENPDGVRFVSSARRHSGSGVPGVGLRICSERNSAENAPPRSPCSLLPRRERLNVRPTSKRSVTSSTGWHGSQPCRIFLRARSKNALSKAHTLLSKIYGWCTEGFDTKDLQDAKALLAELTEEH